MSFNPFSALGDYPSLLNRIATYTFFVAILLVWFLRQQSSAIDDFLATLALQVPIASGVNVPLGTFLPAFVIAFLSRAVKLHDGLSDLLRIRQRFDVGAILLPLAACSGATLSPSAIRSIREQRESLMQKVFYKYTSSTPGKAVIDTHHITMALDQWCWYWIILEAVFLGLCLAVVFLLTRNHLSAALLLLGILISTAVLQVIRHHCENYALREVEEILAEPQRKAEIAGAFNAL